MSNLDFFQNDQRRISHLLRAPLCFNLLVASIFYISCIHTNMFWITFDIFDQNILNNTSAVIWWGMYCIYLKGKVVIKYFHSESGIISIYTFIPLSHPSIRRSYVCASIYPSIIHPLPHPSLRLSVFPLSFCPHIHPSIHPSSNLPTPPLTSLCQN